MSDSECGESTSHHSVSPQNLRPQSPMIKQEQASPQPPQDHHMGMRFTNFFIDEILKPHFGKPGNIELQPPLTNKFKSEFSILSEKFSGLIHRPIPSFNESLKRKVVEQSAALDLRRERVIKKDKSKPESVKCSPGVAVIERGSENCLTGVAPDRGSPNPEQTPSPEKTEEEKDEEDKSNLLWPAWVYCTRYSDRPSSGPRSRRNRRKEKIIQEKRPRTAFSTSQLERLKKEFDNSRYLTEPKRQDLAKELNLNESQIKIWFQNKRAKLKKSNGMRNGLALHLMAQGLYNHSTSSRREEEEIDVES